MIPEIDIWDAKLYDSFALPFLLPEKVVYCVHQTAGRPPRRERSVTGMGGLWSLLTANIPELILLLVGIGLLVFEMYIPGFGVPGIMGIGTLVLGFVLLRPTLEQGLVLFVILAAILCVALSICLITASKGRLAKSKLALNDVVIPEDAAETNDLNYFIGKEGVTHTALRPAGIGEFDGVKLNVVSDGEFIAQGKPIRVLSVTGNRILVAERKD